MKEVSVTKEFHLPRAVKKGNTMDVKNVQGDLLPQTIAFQNRITSPRVEIAVAEQ